MFVFVYIHSRKELFKVAWIQNDVEAKS
uniref:Uncharacterized protein n=1 Tax=Anguilla anguilla TaxID=7936 RepID=A0A0E9Q6M4_ANGAN